MLRTCLFCSAFILFIHVIVPGTCVAGWREDFQKACGNTQAAEKMSMNELDEVIAECDKIEEVIKDSTDSDKKLYLFRVKKCRNFYLFMKETRK
ncbi:MAG: hypothetical protein KKG47_12770 [Proteobacteria bacterium]|nr:hypothetical protein [Pseudomonadota bacterium]MBU1738725.1 hypothetical protein [Pseudomonadota bacterium]